MKYNEEPLKYYYGKYGFEISEVKKTVAGEKYLGMMLEDGRIGVCATLKQKIDVETINDDSFPDLDNLEHRLIYNAYLNAMLNYRSDYKDERDIFEFINFGNYHKIVMIGDFRPLVAKFRQSEMEVSVFDLFSDREGVMPIEKRGKYLSKADGVILTATSIFNNTFHGIMESVNNNCDVFILGPTAILDEDMKRYENVKVIFGTVFDKNDNRILDIIADNQGTRHFQKFGKKVYI